MMARGQTRIAAALAVSLLLNYPLFVAAAPPAIVHLFLSPLLGQKVGLCAAVSCISIAAFVEAVSTVPWVPTPQADLDELLATRAHNTNETFVELGSGDGRNLLRATKLHGFAHATGVELSPLLLVVSHFRAWLAGETDRITLIRANILTEPLPPSVPHMVIYLYLSRGVLVDLGGRLACAYGGHARVSILSRDFELQGWPETRRLERGRTVLLEYSAADAPPCNVNSYDAREGGFASTPTTASS